MTSNGDRIRAAVERADNPVSACREIGRVIGSLLPLTSAERQSVAWSAEKSLASYFPGPGVAKALAGGIVDALTAGNRQNGGRPSEEKPELATLGDGEHTTPEDSFPLLRELMERPELLQPPEAIIPRLAWRGRSTGLIGPDKSGKSTLACHAASALTNAGTFLGERLTRGRAIVCAPDEAVGDTVRRLVEVGADGGRVRVLALRPPDLLAQLDSILSSHPADLAIIDSLAEWARLALGQSPDDGDSAGWGSVVRPLVQLSRAHDVAILLLHHPRRSDGQFRGSGEIAAALDALLEMRPGGQGEDPTLRRITGRARWPVEDFSVRLDGDRFTLGGGGPVSMEARILMDLRVNPASTRADSYRQLGGRKASHTAAVNALIESGGIVDRKGRLFLPDDIEGDFL
jgi:hypothetical protein